MTVCCRTMSCSIKALRPIPVVGDLSVTALQVREQVSQRREEPTIASSKHRPQSPEVVVITMLHIRTAGPQQEVHALIFGLGFAVLSPVAPVLEQSPCACEGLYNGENKASDFKA